MNRSKIIMALLFMLALAQHGQAQDLNFEKLAKGKKVFVEKADKEADSHITAEMVEWGFFKVVTDESEADLIIRISATGKTYWNPSMNVFFVDRESKEILYSSLKGRRSDSFKKASERIVDEMKKRIEQRKK